MSNDNQTSSDLPVAKSLQTPFWVFVLTSVLVFLGGMLFERKGGGANAKVYEPYFSVEMIEKLNPAPGGNKKGRLLYDGACKACHQGTGLGAVGVAPPLAGSEWVTGEGINRLAKIVYHGVQGPIEVKGTKWNLVMPAMGKQLAWSNNQLADLINYLRENEEWGNAAPKITADDVEKALDGVRDRASGWTSPELLELPEVGE